MATWSLTYGGRQKSFADWGIEDLQFQFVSQGPDTVSFSVPMAFDGARLFAYGSKITIQLGETKWFVGTVIRPDVRGAAQSERQQFTAVGPWYQLTELVLQQVWNWFLSNNHVQFSTSTSHLILNGTADGLSLVKTGATIRAILQYVIDQLPGAVPFQIGTIFDGLFPPVNEVRDISCAEALKLELRWHPDAVTWFDYTTDPPTFNCKLYADLSAVAFAIGVDAIEEVQLESREDLQRPSVAIRYEVRTTVDDAERLSLISDIYPLVATGRELHALVATVDSQGGKITNISAELGVQAIPADLTAAASLDWWKAKFPESLGDGRLVGVQISNAGRVLVNEDGSRTVIPPGQGLPNELVFGQWAEWMGGNAQREEISVQATYSVYDAVGAATPRLTLSDPKIFTRAITTTDLAGGVYQGPKRIDQLADPIPVGLAKYLYDACAILHYGGTLKLVESEVSGRLRPGMVVNLTGGNAAWAGMRALVQSVAEDVASGTTTVALGPPEHLGISDLGELLRVNRTRNRTGQPGAQSSGEISSGAEGPLGKQTANADRAAGSELLSLQVIKKGTIAVTLDAAGLVTITDTAHSGRAITLNIGQCVSGLIDLGVDLKETVICDENGLPKKCKVLRSQTYA